MVNYGAGTKIGVRASMFLSIAKKRTTGGQDYFQFLYSFFRLIFPRNVPKDRQFKGLQTSLTF
jgi:hypothetical protein